MKKILFFIIGIFLLSVCYSQPQQKELLHKIKKDVKWGYIDNKGDTIIPCEYLVLGDLGEKDVPVRAQKTRNQWIYVDGNGKEITGNESYEYAYPFYDSDLALVGSEGRFGYINKQGRLRIPLQYKKAYPFSEELAAVKKVNNRKFGFINTGGNEVIKPLYTEVKWGFVGGYAWVKRGNRWGVINKWGTTIIGFDYMQLSYFDPNTGAADAITRKGDKHFYYKGKIYTSKKDRDETLKPRIIWPIIPDKTNEQLFVFNAKIKSDSKLGSCKVLLDNEEVLDMSASTDSTIVRDQKKKDEYQYSQIVNRTLALHEGENTIAIEVQNTEGEVVKLEQRHITYNVKPTLATIKWNEVPSMTEQKLFLIRAEIESESKIEYYRILRNDYVYQNDILNVVSDGDKTNKGAFTLGGTYNEKNGTFEYAINKSIELLDGENTIVIEVKNKSDSISRKEQTIFYKHVEKRIALVIGNWDYNTPEFKSLMCPQNDADSIYKLLETSGYDMMPQEGPLIDANKEEMEKVIKAFMKKIQIEKYDVAFFYFSGHGISPKKGKNNVYLIPSKNSIHCEMEATQQGVNVQDLLIDEKYRHLENCHAFIVLLDCCRSCGLSEECGDEGINKGNNDGGGLSYFSLGKENIAVVYATQEGKIAEDCKSGYNSPFVEGILNCAKTDESWPNFVYRLSDYVLKKTGEQKPDCVGGFYGAADFKPFSTNK